MLLTSYVSRLVQVCKSTVQYVQFDQPKILLRFWIGDCFSLTSSIFSGTLWIICHLGLLINNMVNKTKQGKKTTTSLRTQITLITVLIHHK